MNAKPKGNNEINASTLKLIIEGNKFVYEMRRKEIANINPDNAIILKPNLRPLDTIHVILPPNLSPSRSGISTPMVNNNCKNNKSMEKIRKLRSIVPIITK